MIGTSSKQNSDSRQYQSPLLHSMDILQAFDGSVEWV